MQMKKKIKEEIKILQGELLMKDELLQQLNSECRELKQELVKSRKKEEKANYLNTTLMNQQVRCENHYLVFFLAFLLITKMLAELLRSRIGS